MDSIKITQPSPDRFHVEGFPDAVAIVRPIGNLAEISVLKQLALHRHDLKSADKILNAINGICDFSLQSDLWEFAVVKVTKCFKKANGRKPLDANLILGNKPQGMECLKFFLSMRDKFIVHDDNSFMQCDLGLVIGPPEKSYAIEKVVTLTLQAITLGPENLQNLKQLIADSLTWIHTEYDQNATKISQHYETLGREELLKFQPMTSETKMSAEDIHINRGKSK